MVAANLTSLFNTLITGLHILHYNGVLDAYGHLSVRNPNNGSNFFMSRNLAPALVANSSDIVEYRVEDASPIDPNAPSGFIERYLHSEIYKRFPSINSVVHSHSPQVVPYSISGVPLRPAIHMAGFLGVYHVLCKFSKVSLILINRRGGPQLQHNRTLPARRESRHPNPFPTPRCRLRRRVHLKPHPPKRHADRSRLRRRLDAKPRLHNRSRKHRASRHASHLHASQRGYSDHRSDDPECVSG